MVYNSQELSTPVGQVLNSDEFGLEPSILLDPIQVSPESGHVIGLWYCVNTDFLLLRKYFYSPGLHEIAVLVADRANKPPSGRPFHPWLRVIVYDLAFDPFNRVRRDSTRTFFLKDDSSLVSGSVSDEGSDRVEQVRYE